VAISCTDCVNVRNAEYSHVGGRVDALRVGRIKEKPTVGVVDKNNWRCEHCMMKPEGL